MIKVKRPAEAPGSLASAAALKEAADAETYYSTWVLGQKAFEFSHYRGEDVLQALRKAFSGKCAYCERQIEKGDTEVEHYRPKGKVEGDAHPGYWWLAHCWSNLLPSCPACNKALLQHLVTAEMSVTDVEKLQSMKRKTLCGKAMQFPVTAARLIAKVDDHAVEGPLLIDPTRDEPEPELLWRSDVSWSVVEGEDVGGSKSLAGEATVHCLALNRIDLVEHRTRLLDVLKQHRINILQDLDQETGVADGLHLGFALSRIKDLSSLCESDQQFSAMAREFVMKFKQEVLAIAVQRGVAV